MAVMPPSLTLSVRPSATLAAVLFGGHALAVFALLPLVLPLAPKIVLALALAESARRSMRHILALSPRSVGAVTLGRERAVTLHFVDGSTAEGLADDATTVTSWLVILICRLDAGRSCAAVLARDALGSAGHRELRIWLRWSAPGSPVQEQEGGAGRI